MAILTLRPTLAALSDDSDTTGESISNAGEVRVYELADPAEYMSSVTAVRCSIRSKMSTGNATADFGLDLAGSRLLTRATILSGSIARYDGDWHTSRPGGGAWTVADVNALRGAVSSGISPTYTHSVYEMYVDVDYVPNVAPNAPILTAPADGAILDRNITQRGDHDFSDPDPGDSQSAHQYDVWSLDAAGSRTGLFTSTGKAATPNTFHDWPAGTFPAGDYEWTVSKTWDAQGAEGPGAPSRFFTAADAPPTPTITELVSGATIPQEQPVGWSAPDQDAYQLRRVADNAGAPDATTVYYDTGEVVTATARSRTVTFETNDRYEHIQVRIKHDGLWSSWASIRVLVSYTRPPVPTLTITTSDTEAATSVAITNPTPAAGEPPVTHVRLFARASAANPNADPYRPYPDGTRIEAFKPPNSTAIDHLPAGGVDYEYRAEAVGDNGTTSDSGWVGASAAAETVVYYGGGYDE
jgi:hypothetical protein